jgi:GAF domain-containing protein
METDELRRLIVRHRHVAPMLSALLAGTDARVMITDVDETVILDRQGGAEGQAATVERHPILVDGSPVGWVAGPRPAGAIATVLSYACAREADKRSLAREALDRYRELNLIYDLADQIGAVLEIDAVARVAVDEAGRLPTGGRGFVRLRADADAPLVVRPTGDDPVPPVAPGSGILGAIAVGDAEIVNDVAGDPRANQAERGFASIVAAPLRVRGERIGIIGTLSTEPVEYHASDLRLLSAIASLTAPTLDQAATYEAALPASALASD